MMGIYLKLCMISVLALTPVAAVGDRNIPKQMKQLYKQFKRGDFLDDLNINTVRYIRAHQGSVTSEKNLLYNLDSLNQESEVLLRAELHYYRRTTEIMQTIQVDVSELSPYYVTLAQRERRSPVGRGWQQMDITKSVLQCTNTLRKYNQLGVAFSELNKDAVAVPVDMPSFLRHHSLPFILLYSNNSRSLEIDQVGDRTSDVVDELNSMIDPATGKAGGSKGKSSSPRSRRSILDNRIELEPDSNAVPALNKWINVDDFYNELTNNIEVEYPSLKDVLKTKQEQTTLAAELDTPAVEQEKNSKASKNTMQYIPWPLKTDNKNKKKKNKNIQLLPRKFKNTEVELTPGTSESCGRKSLRVNFDDIGWGERMIEPKKFDAYYCAGECNFPNSLGKHMTNHATLQSLLTSIRIRSDVPQPCCVPQKLESVTLMFYDKYKNIVLKRYPDMSVESCACR